MAALLHGLGMGALFFASFAFAILIVVVAHEFGHFQTARWLGVRADVFSIGFGKPLWRWRDRHGTEWRLARWPIGGFVKFEGDADASSRPDEAYSIALPSDPAERRRLQATGIFHYQPVWRRVLIVAAGPAASFLLGIAIFAGFYGTIGEVVTPARVDGVVAGGAAARAGFQIGDVIERADGHRIRSFDELREKVSLRAGAPIRFDIRRGAAAMTIAATPERRVVSDEFAGRRAIGVLGLEGRPGRADVRLIRYSPAQAVVRGGEQCWRIVATTGDYLGRVFRGRESGQDFSGPLAIAYAPGKIVSLATQSAPGERISLIERIFSGLRALVLFSAVLSVSIGMTNLLPIPVLDGGQIVLYGLEALRGRPLGARAAAAIGMAGLATIAFLGLFATWNDLHRFEIFKRLGALWS